MEKEIKSISQSHSDNQQKKKQTISLDTTLEPIEIVKSVLVSSARAYRTLGSRLETNFFDLKKKKKKKQKIETKN